MRAPFVIFFFAVGLVACGRASLDARDEPASRGAHGSARAEPPAIERADATRPIADLEVSVAPEVSREDLALEAQRRIDSVEGWAERGCDVGARLVRMRTLASSLETAADPWNDYAMVVTIARRVVADCE